MLIRDLVQIIQYSEIAIETYVEKNSHKFQTVNEFWVLIEKKYKIEGTRSLEMQAGTSYLPRFSRYSGLKIHGQNYKGLCYWIHGGDPKKECLPTLTWRSELDIGCFAIFFCDRTTERTVAISVNLESSTLACREACTEFVAHRKYNIWIYSRVT